MTRGSHIESGKSGEEIAEKYLTTCGFRVLDRRFRNKISEIDLIVQKKGEIYFVEVKARSGRSHGDSLEQVSFYKQRKIIAGAKLWLVRHFDEWPACHFSVVGVDMGSKPPEVVFIPDAFDSDEWA